MDAQLEKRGGFAFGMKDVFVNIAGGLKIEDPSMDLAIILALLSSFEDLPLPQGICFAGEVGLNGEIRAVNRIQQRIAEAENNIIVSTKVFSKKDAQEIAVEWRIYIKDSKLLVRDLVVEGLSLARTQKEEFASIIASKGFAGVISALETFNKSN